MPDRQQYQSQPQNPPNIPVFVDATATQVGGLPSNQNNRFILRPIENNQQAQATRRYNHNAVPPFPVQTWQLINTSLIDITSATVYFAANPGAYAIASSTYFPPQGQPIIIDILAWGYEVTGQWHVAYLEDSLGHRQRQIEPNVYPVWTRGILRSLDRVYRHEEVIYTGLSWPTPAIGMTMSLLAIREVERSGIYIHTIDRNGYVTWLWQGI
ncbi:hypothetical protein NCS52_00174600 [Fusarium sp. LHS14.1]|nr:hypothetical protein NCS52_01488500 [Fusarium sp. LHS14.1]KAI8723193.1 hypothetical protein NCS52_00174600 [Fusarium sp. LHS14.1]